MSQPAWYKWSTYTIVKRRPMYWLAQPAIAPPLSLYVCRDQHGVTQPGCREKEMRRYSRNRTLLIIAGKPPIHHDIIKWRKIVWRTENTLCAHGTESDAGNPKKGTYAIRDHGGDCGRMRRETFRRFEDQIAGKYHRTCEPCDKKLKPENHDTTLSVPILGKTRRRRHTPVIKRIA